MTAQDMYKETLLEHYRHPRNRCEGPIQNADATERGANPRCGDEVEVAIFLQDDTIEQVKFRGRGCAICIASASMMTETVNGNSVTRALDLCDQMRAWFGRPESPTADSLPHSLNALEAVRNHPARKKCVLLSWEALAGAIAQAPAR